MWSDWLLLSVSDWPIILIGPGGLLSVSDWPIILLIGPGGLLLVDPYQFAVLVLVSWVGGWKKVNN
jgi:hypothetical protein